MASFNEIRPLSRPIQRYRVTWNSVYRTDKGRTDDIIPSLCIIIIIMFVYYSCCLSSF